jgi:2'-5' RNA ligase
LQSWPIIIAEARPRRAPARLALLAYWAGLCRNGPMTTHRLFFALSPPPPERRRISAAAERVTAAQRAPGRPTAIGQLHLTLAYLGEFEGDEAIARARAVGERVRAAPFSLRIDQAGSFGPTWYLGSASPTPELDAMQAQLAAQLQQAGFTLEERAFHAHVTFQRKAEHALPPTRIAPIRWLVESISLFDSIPSERRYLPLASWPLRD